MLPNSKGMFHVSLEGVQKRLLNLELPTTPCVSFVMITSEIIVISRPLGCIRASPGAGKTVPSVGASCDSLFVELWFVSLSAL